MVTVRMLAVTEDDDQIAVSLDEPAREGPRRMIAVALKAEAVRVRTLLLAAGPTYASKADYVANTRLGSDRCHGIWRSDDGARAV